MLFVQCHDAAPVRGFGAAAGDTELKFFVKKEGDTSDAVVTATPSMLVGELKKSIIEELGLTERPSVLELVAVVKGAGGEELHRALNTRNTVGEEGLASRATIFIRPTRTAASIAAAAIARAAAAAAAAEAGAFLPPPTCWIPFCDATRRSDSPRAARGLFGLHCTAPRV
jgi:hypothetical protein